MELHDQQIDTTLRINQTARIINDSVASGEARNQECLWNYNQDIQEWCFVIKRLAYIASTFVCKLWLFFINSWCIFNNSDYQKNLNWYRCENILNSRIVVRHYIHLYNKQLIEFYNIRDIILLIQSYKWSPPQIVIEIHIYL